LKKAIVHDACVVPDARREANPYFDMDSPSPLGILNRPLYSL